MADITKEQVTVTINGVTIDEKTYDYIFKSGYKLGCEERKQSKWYMRGGKFTCKNCEERALLKLTDASGGCKEYSYYPSNYCPNCGAEMRKE